MTSLFWDNIAFVTALFCDICFGHSRRQGSVYVFDNTTTPPTLTQLDEWHEATHFGRWSHAVQLEAALHDAHTAAQVDTINAIVKATEVPPSAHPGDYSSFTTYVKITSGCLAEYSFVLRSGPRETETTLTPVFIVLRGRGVVPNNGRSPVGSTCVAVRLDGSDDVSNACWQGAWRWCRVRGRFAVHGHTQSVCEPVGVFCTCVRGCE